MLLGRKRKQDTAAAAVVIRIQDKRNRVVVGEVRNHEFTIYNRTAFRTAMLKVSTKVHPIMKKIQMKRKMSCIQKLMQISFNGNLPLQAAREFLGSSGPKHSLGPGTATPSIFFFFFGLFIPMFFWVRFANHTNSKAEMVGRSRMDMCGSGKNMWC